MEALPDKPDKKENLMGRYILFSIEDDPGKGMMGWVIEFYFRV